MVKTEEKVVKALVECPYCGEVSRVLVHPAGPFPDVDACSFCAQELLVTSRVEGDDLSVWVWRF